MLVLAIDTSTPTVTAGVVDLKRPAEILEAMIAAGEMPPASRAGGTFGVLSSVPPSTVLAEHTIDDAFGHAEHLMPLVAAALADADRAVGDVDAVVVGTGPGPFTGLRVGMATAAALGDALGVPVHGVPSHDAMARRAAHAGDFLVVTDARRKEVYLSAYQESAARLQGPMVIAPRDIAELLASQRLSPEWVTGAGASLVAEGLGLPVREGVAPLSEFLVDLAAGQLLTGAVPGPLTPLYLRRPDATAPGAPKPVLGASGNDPAPRSPVEQPAQR